MNRHLISVVLAVSAGLNCPALAMTLERVGNDLYATGPTVDQDFLKFKEAFNREGIHRLILVNGPGGDLWTGMQIAHMVREAKVKTVVSGYCMSACSLIFMAGRERAFGTGHAPRMTVLGIHGAHDTLSKRILPEAIPQMYVLYKSQMGDKFDAQVMNQALYNIQDANGFLRMREVQRTNENDRTPWFCATGQTPIEQCQQHVGKDAFSLGVITQKETISLELPESMQPRIGFFGRTLTPASADFEDRASSFIESLCNGQLLCKTIGQRTFNNYLKANHNKALAVGWGKTGYGIRWGTDDTGQAMMRALYACNHAQNNPKLCRLVAVNDHELLPIYESAARQADELLKNLKPPRPEWVQQEREEPGASTPNKLRTGQNVSGMTPRALAGIERWDTATLAQALRQSNPPVLIDTASFGPVIPGALNIINSGLAFEDEKLEQAYAERFKNILQVASPDMTKPVVFYCASSECWLSVNAAMRAHRLGYSRVIWYRGGLAAWTQAGLPTLERAPVAVLH